MKSKWLFQCGSGLQDFSHLVLYRNVFEIITHLFRESGGMCVTDTDGLPSYNLQRSASLLLFLVVKEVKINPEKP